MFSKIDGREGEREKERKFRVCEERKKNGNFVRILFQAGYITGMMEKNLRYQL